MLAFAKSMFKDKYKSLIAYVTGSIIFLEMYIALFPSISKQSEQLNQMMTAFPPEFFKAFNIDPGSMTFGSLEPYLSSEYMSFLWPILAIIFAISLANYVSVKEIDSGTVEAVASLPVKRERIFIERYLTGAGLLMVFSLFSMLLAIPLAKIHNIDFIAQNYITSAIGSFFLAWAIYSLALLFSTFTSEKGKATALTSGVLLLMYVINIIASLKEELSDLKYVSFFNYFNGSELLAKNTFPEYSLLVLGGFSIVATTLALFWYRHRDLSV